jgi:hypothetical protein
MLHVYVMVLSITAANISAYTSRRIHLAPRSGKSCNVIRQGNNFNRRYHSSSRHAAKGMSNVVRLYFLPVGELIES